MSSLTTTSINTANASTPLTVGTGNGAGPVIIISGGTDLAIRANTTANVFIANSSGLRANASVTVANTLTVTGQTTLNTVANGASFSGNTTLANVVANNITVSSNSFTFGGSSIGTSGYTRLPNQLLLHWGTVTSNSASGTVTFNPAFQAAPFSVVLTGSSLSTATYAYTTAATASSATIRSTSTANPASNVYFYMAIGQGT